MLGFIEGLDERFKQQSQSSEEFALVVQVPAEVIEEERRRLGELKTKSIKIPIEKIDMEAYSEGLEHAKETKLLQEELLQKRGAATC